MIIGDFNWKRVPNGRKGCDGKELHDYVLVNPDMEKYCVYGSKFYFILAPQKKNDLYRIIEGSVSYSKETFSLGVVGEYVKNRRYASRLAQDIVPWYGDDISRKHLGITGDLSYKIAIFETLDEANEFCDKFNKELREKRKAESDAKDRAEYERLKKKLGL